MRIFNCLKQLFPLTYRTRYWDSEHRHHLRVWRQWFGRCFQVDDVVIGCDAEMERRSLEAYDRGEYKTIAEIKEELRAKSTMPGQRPRLDETVTVGGPIADPPCAETVPAPRLA